MNIDLWGLWRRRSQVRLTICGIAVGVFSVLIISAVGSAGQRLIRRELEQLGFDCVTLSASQKELNTLDPSQLEQVRQLKEVAAAAPLNTCLGRAVMRDYSGQVLLCGVDSSAQRIIQLKLRYGRFFQESDIAAGENLCVVDEALAQAFYKRSNIVGKTMTVTVDQGVQDFTVIGVVSAEESVIKNLTGGTLPSMVYIPYTAHQELCRSAVIDQLFLKAVPGVEPVVAGKKAVALLDSLAGYKNLYRCQDLAVQRDRLDRLLSGATLALSAIGGISLVVSGLSIMTIMTASVRERTREIGIKRAVGARTAQILWEFLLEAILLTLTGSLLGMMCCQILILAVGWILGVQLRLEMGIIAGTLLFSIVTGGVFGIYPAKVATRLKPAQALRYE